MEIKVAIVLLNWNGIKYLKQFLPFVIKNTNKPEYKIIVVDNSSTDDSVAFLKENFPEVEIMELSQNYGYAKGYALALEQIQSEYFILLNSDIEVTENWISPIIELMDKNTRIAAAMPKIRSFASREHFEYSGAAGGFIDKFGYPFCQGRILTKVEEDTGQYEEIKEIFWASGACMFLRSSAYTASGGFDVDFFAHMEEIDLCWRLKRMNYQIVYYPYSKVFHVGGGTLPNDNPRKLYYNYRNNLYLLFKNLRAIHFLTSFVPRVLLDMLSCCVYLLQGKFLFSISVFRAYCRFCCNLIRLMRKRIIFNKKISNRQVSHIYPKSIVIDFFIKGKKKYSDINFY